MKDEKPPPETATEQWIRELWPVDKAIADGSRPPTEKPPSEVVAGLRKQWSECNPRGMGPAGAWHDGALDDAMANALPRLLDAAEVAQRLAVALDRADSAQQSEDGFPSDEAEAALADARRLGLLP